MQTLGLNLATAAPDAGADSALQSTAAAPSGAGAIFEILMTAAGAGTPDLSISPDATAQAVGAYPADAVTAAPDPLMQALAGASTGIATGLDASGNQTNKFGADLASDMENMVQALAITAEVVAQGMAARTTPVREIILTVETPNSETPADPALPNLNIVVPAPTDTGLTLKVSEADPDKNLDPALLTLMPQISPTPAAATQVDDVAANGPDLLAAPVEPAPDAPIVAEIPAAQAVSTAMEETYGPWRAEIYGPVLNDRRELIPGPVHVPIFEPPASVPQSASLPSADADIPQMTDAPLLDEPALLTKPDASPANTLMGAPIRVVTIHVPPKAVTAPEEAEAEDDETGTDILVVTQAAPAETNAVEVRSSTPMDVKPDEFIGPQLIQMVPSEPQRATHEVPENDTLPDTLQAPRATQPDAPKIVVVTTSGDTSKPAPPSTTAPPALTRTFVAQTASATPEADFDIAAVVDALRKDADLFRAAHRHADDALKFASNTETNLQNPVAKTSSRSGSDIRDLMKSGVRDIEILQSNGGAQDMNVSVQLQTSDLTGAVSATRTQVADAFAPSGSEANSAERRAQAHEIRMRAIERQVVNAVRDGADTIRMQLYPPGLGQIIIRLTMDGSKLKLTTSASSRDAADSLRSIEGDLRDALSVGGLELAGFDVSEDGDGGNKGRKNASDTDNNPQHTRSAKSDDFALDMNA